MHESTHDQLEKARGLLECYKPQDALELLDPLIASLIKSAEPSAHEAELHELAGQAALAAGNFIAAQDHLRHAGEQLDILSERRRLLACQLGLAECALRQGNLPKSRHISTTSLLVATENGWDEHQAKSLLVLGNIAWSEGDIGAAEDYLGRALEGFEKLGQPDNANRVRCSLGITKDISGDSEQALELLKLALEFFRTAQDFTQVVRCLNNLAGVTFKKRDYSRAREYLLQCVELETEIQNQGDLALTWYNLGLIETNSGDLKLARKYLNRAFQIAQDMGQRANQGSALLQLAVVSIMEDKSEESINYAQLAAARFEGSSSAYAILIQYYVPVFLLAGGHIERAEKKWAQKPRGGNPDQLLALSDLLDHMAGKSVSPGATLTHEVTDLMRQWSQQLRSETGGVVS